MIRHSDKKLYIKIRYPELLLKVQVEADHLSGAEVGGPLHPVVCPGELEGGGHREPEVHRVNVVDVDQADHRVHFKRLSIRPTLRTQR